ncbi:hypothetical protein HB662_25895 [Roseomonas frigidaquae]|uniref:Uncharacterized protein n=1 Tax=Falsiroseomonas frigidaquae TaxID=487318 RepID=A0ABX1F777_9PROT|nr:hypothetical protein [Falsiroseomonas frigidaquae]NKE48236.1 hypothetical protein [Falsiroseomonas frigidaquae]
MRPLPLPECLGVLHDAPPPAPANDTAPPPGPETIIWRQGDGEDTVIGGGGGDTLCIAASDLTLPLLLLAIEVDDGGPAPSLHGGWIDIAGIKGRLVLGSECLCFQAMERLILQPPAAG